jgi:outer membrane receptor protein involved in Fe transport
LKVSDAPQSQFGLLADAQLDNGFEMGLSYIFNVKLYAKFDPAIDRTQLHPERIGFQPVLLPSFGYLDARIRYKFDPIDSWGGARIALSLNIQNVTNNRYISYGFEEWRTEQVYDENWNVIEERNYQGTVENGFLQGWHAFGRTLSFSVKMTI